MRNKDYVVAVLLLWLMWPRETESTDVNIVLTEPGFEGLPIEEELSY